MAKGPDRGGCSRMTQKMNVESELTGDEDLEDIEWELLSSAREATVGWVPAPVERFPPVLPTLDRSHPWERR